MTIRDKIIEDANKNIKFWSNVEKHNSTNQKYPNAYSLKNGETINDYCWRQCWLLLWEAIGQLVYLDAGLGSVERFNTEQELFNKYPGPQWEKYGPIHKHGQKYYVQTYLGGHCSLAININDIADVKNDAGWDGTIFGYAYVNYPDTIFKVIYSLASGDTEPPEREGKPITGDEILFSDKEKLFKYLGDEDPIVENWDKESK